MLIANPIYDVVFKRMMENQKVAKFFIATLLEEVIEAVEVKPQEFTYTDELAGLAVFRLDFIATIKTESGAYKKVLIEIQKAKNEIDLMRFRSYLAEQYKKEDTVNDEKVILPITTIYILGFTIPEIPSPCIKVERNYKDLINNIELVEKSDFIEKLTHDCFVVQIDRITDRYQTRLDKLLSVFEQTNFTDDTQITKQYNHTADVEEVKIITDILHHSGTNPAERKQIEIEQEAWRTVNAMFEEKQKKFEKKEKILKEGIVENIKALSAKDKTISEKDKTINEKDKTLSEKDKALSEKDKLIEELKKQLGK